MNDYKNKVIQLINSNAVVNEKLYKEIYNNIINDIKPNNSLLEKNIIDNYDEKQLFYIIHSNIFIMCYQNDTDFMILNEDELICDISENIDINIFSIEKKHEIIKNIIIKKKKEKIKDFIPESETIQLVLDIFNTILYNNKDVCKFVLILIGELIEHKLNNTIYFVNNDFKTLLKYILDYGYSYFKTDSINLENFKTKHYNYNLNNSLVIPCNKCKVFYCDLIKNNIIQIILVSIYYKNRYKSSNNFIETKLNSELKEYFCYFNNKTIHNIIEEFDNKYLEKSTCLKITHSELHYLWKDYCSNENIPNVVSFNQLKDYYNDDMLYKTSSKLEYVSEFIDFWNDTIYVDDNETKFEISEIQQLLKLKRNVTLNEKKIISLISHFYNVDIENEKYINNVNCYCFCKKNILNTFKKSDYYNKTTNINSQYKKYIDWENSLTKSHNRVDIVISKNYFIEHI
tara:strand:- start:241 stop:1611 length:1371 start_codon:yes stop_codon:yes gene_type:complete